MNERIDQILKQVSEYWTSLSNAKKVALVVVGAIVLISGVTGVLIFRQDPFQVLYTDLQPEEGRAVAKKLAEMNVPYHLTESGTTIMVPTSQVSQSRMQLAKAGLPGQDVVGFEKFDGTTLGMSSYVQRIQYIRAMQGELTRSIQRLNAVKHARVHISMPPKKTFAEDEDPPKASVVLEMKSGQSLSKSEVVGVAHLVASAVEGLKVNQVTIVDAQGNFLHRPEGESNQAISSTLLELQRSIESEYERRVIDMLTPIVGYGKVRAKVTAEVDPARVNTTEESYDPDKVVPKNIVKNDESSTGSRPTPAGIPGSRSNLPGAETPPNAAPVASNSNEKSMQNTSYAIPRKVQVVDKPSGSIKRLTVAVVVDGTYTKAVDGVGKDVFTPRADEELKRFQDLVANSVGFDSQRRDVIQVTSLPFSVTENTDAPAPSEPIQWWHKDELMRHGIRNSLIAVVILSFFILVLRPFIKWASVKDAPQEVVALPKTVAQIEAERRHEGLLAISQGTKDLPQLEPVDKKEEEELKKKIIDGITQSPRKGISIVQDWLEEEQQQHTAESATEAAA